jgi:L-fuculose-phosphate aldolase
MTGIVPDARKDAASQLLSARANLTGCGSLAGCVGELSVRIPDTELALVTPHVSLAVPLQRSALQEMTLDGRILHKRARPAFSAQVHLEIYKQRPDVGAIVHTHAPFATVMGICALPIPPVTFDAIPFANLARVEISEHTADRWPQEVAAEMSGGAGAALLIHDGTIAVGAHLLEVVRRTIALEETARILVLAYLLDQLPSTVPPEAVQVLKQVPF